MKFSEQSELWFEWLRTRKRAPLKKGSLATYRSYLNRILPRLGAEEVSTFGNAGLKLFVADLATTGLGPKSIFEIVATVKQIVASVVDENGDQRYPRVWNSDFVDIPVVDKSKQCAPCATRAQVDRALGETSEKYSAFYALLAGTGLRVGEARAIRIGDDGVHTAWSPDAKLILVRTAFWRGVEQTPKTAAAVRAIDLTTALNDYLMDFCSSRASGLVPSTGELMFTSDSGSAMYDSTIRKCSLKRLGIKGFHALRRFRVTHLREYGVPEDIIRYWTGHVSNGITDRYSKLAQNVELRKQWVERAGLGFEIPKKQIAEDVVEEAHAETDVHESAAV